MDDPRIATRESRIANSDTLYTVVAEILTERTTAHWIDFCQTHGIPATKAASLDELVEELPLADHPRSGPYRVIPPPVRFSATPASVRRPAPLHGEDGRAVLAEAGYDAETLDALAEAGVLIEPPG